MDVVKPTRTLPLWGAVGMLKQSLRAMDVYLFIVFLFILCAFTDKVLQLQNKDTFKQTETKLLFKSNKNKEGRVEVLVHWHIQSFQKRGFRFVSFYHYCAASVRSALCTYHHPLID